MKLLLNLVKPVAHNTINYTKNVRKEPLYKYTVLHALFQRARITETIE